MKEQLITTSIRVQQSVLDQLQLIADRDPKVNSRTNLIKNILIDYVENNNKIKDVVVLGIYSITSKNNGKVYVGQSIDINKRWKGHLSHLKHNKHYSQDLQDTYNKYGEEDLIFKVLEEVNDVNLLTEKEKYWMDNINPEFNAYCTGNQTRKENSKNYSYNKKLNNYIVYYSYLGKLLRFSYHSTEEEAVKEVEYIKCLAYEDLIEYEKKCREETKSRRTRRNAKNYSLNSHGKFEVRFSINGKTTYFGCYETEEEAINKAKQVELELGRQPRH